MHAKACQWPNGEWGSSTRCHMHGREFPELVLPDRALYLPTFSHLLIVNKLLSLSRARARTPAPSPPSLSPSPSPSNPPKA
jgi:hypothetical protein